MLFCSSLKNFASRLPAPREGHNMSPFPEFYRLTHATPSHLGEKCKPPRRVAGPKTSVQLSLTPAFATLPQIEPITSLFATLPNSLDLKSFVCHTSDKTGGASPFSLTRTPTTHFHSASFDPPTKCASRIKSGPASSVIFTSLPPYLLASSFGFSS